MNGIILITLEHMKRTYTETVLGEAGQHNCLPAFCPGQELGVGEKEGVVFEQRGGVFLLRHSNFPGELPNETQELSILCRQWRQLSPSTGTF